MKFLQTVCCLGLVVGSMAATPKEEEKEGARLAETISCGGRVWENDQKLGHYGWGEPQQDVITKIVNNRIYIWQYGGYQGNLGVLYGMTQKVAGWPETNGEIDALRDACINPPDPSITGGGYLQPAGIGAVTCNGKLITDNLLIGTYIGGDNVHSETYARVIDGVLLGFVWRRDGSAGFPNPTIDGFNSGLLDEVIKKENGSFLNASLGYTLTEDEVNRCFYVKRPVPLVSKPNCSVQPTVQSVTSITQTSLNFAFSGTGITMLKWRIKPIVPNSAYDRSGTTGVTISGSTVGISYTSLPAGSYKLEIEGESCSSNTATYDFTVAGCTTQPTVTSVTSITASSLSFVFTGSGITMLNWRIKPVVPNNSYDRSGTTGTTSSGSTIPISFATLPSGSYKLEIEGASCTSNTATYDFTIVCIPTSISSIGSIKPYGLTMQFDAANNNVLDWTIKNSASTTVLSGRATTSPGATNHSISYASLPSGAYTLDIQSVSCASGSGARVFRTSDTESFTVSSGTEDRPNCDRGPTVTDTWDEANSGMVFQFDGNNVYSIAWRVLNASKTSVVANSGANIEPATPGIGNSPSINFNLPDGTYWLEIQGGTTCKSTPDLQAFGINVPLPIRISNFKGQAKQEGINLSWNVVSEDNGDRFQLLRFDDNDKTPKMLGEVLLREQAVGGYEFLDKTPSSGANYYQLKQIDKDETFSMSRIIAVNYEQLYEMVLAPNPSREYADVDFESRVNGTATFETYNVSGIRLLTTKHNVKIGKNRIRINVANLADGNYILKIDNQEQTKSMRFLKLR